MCRYLILWGGRIMFESSLKIKDAAVVGGPITFESNLIVTAQAMQGDRVKLGFQVA